MRRLLDCDFFVADEDPGGDEVEDRLHVFPGPRGIVIADARVQLRPGVRVRHGEAFETGSGIEFVFYREEDEAANDSPRCLEMRFVVRGARYDPDMAYRLRPGPAADPSR